MRDDTYNPNNAIGESQDNQLFQSGAIDVDDTVIFKNETFSLHASNLTGSNLPRTSRHLPPLRNPTTPLSMSSND